jgi:hypothetical protein
MITNSIRSIVKTDAFNEWCKVQRMNDGDFVVFNNSFIYREHIKTSKNKQYLSIKVNQGKPDPSDVVVTEPGDLNSDFKLISGKSNDLLTSQWLDDALRHEMNKLGQLIFILIGELEDIPLVVPIKHHFVNLLKFDPSAKGGKLIIEDDKKIILVNQLVDPEIVWNEIKSQLEQELGNVASIETAFAAAFEKLQDEARLKLRIPRMDTPRTNMSFIAQLRESLSKQRELYESAINEYSNKGSDEIHLRDAMRIAYNFSDDAIKVLRLLVSIADLKGILLWCTIKEHFDISNAFRNLPWSKSRKKPSLEGYKEIINGARNHAFHNLLAFDRTIEADLAGVTVNARLLTLLPSYSHRKSNIPFDYEDREMVDILGELTRAPETTVSLDFWKKNAVVMGTFERLLKRTEDALWALNSVYNTK